jgi:predicted transcriptional regulator
MVWQSGGQLNDQGLPAAAGQILGLLRQEGAMFTDDLQQRLDVLRPQLEQALGTLVARGLVTADAFSPLRWLIRPEATRRRHQFQLAPWRSAAGDLLALERRAV